MIKSFVMIGLALVLLGGTPAKANQTYCEATVSERLDLLNVDPSDVSGIFYDAICKTGRNNGVRRILAWVSLRSCKGRLVIELDRHCRVRQVYGRGECSLGGTLSTWP